MRVEFKLSMSKIGSWDGRWSGEDKNYVIYKNVSKDRCKWLGLKTENDKQSWAYDFGDGWVACIAARLYPSNLKKEKSDGFRGYEWMVDNIIKWGCPRYDCEIGGYRPRHIFKLTEEFKNRQKGDKFKCERCGKVLTLGVDNIDFISIK